MAELSGTLDGVGLPAIVRFLIGLKKTGSLRLTQLDWRSFHVFYEVLGRELGRSGAGRVQLLDWVRREDGTWPSTLSGGWHHLGTTRMHENPRFGVVDATCRVHGLGNLYVAGASVYPTSGAVNPTLTLVALSLRLSDHLKRTLA